MKFHCRARTAENDQMPRGERGSLFARAERAPLPCLATAHFNAVATVARARPTVPAMTTPILAAA